MTDQSFFDTWQRAWPERYLWYDQKGFFNTSRAWPQFCCCCCCCCCCWDTSQRAWPQSILWNVTTDLARGFSVTCSNFFSRGFSVIPHNELATPSLWAWLFEMLIRSTGPSMASRSGPTATVTACLQRTAGAAHLIPWHVLRPAAATCLIPWLHRDQLKHQT